MPRLRTRLDDAIGHLRYEPGGTLLEIGCGDGAFLRSMKALGWNVTGTETDARSAAVAGSGGLDIRQGELDDLGLPEAHYSAIVMRHAIEHVMDPAQVLAQCYSLLRPGGTLVLTTPNPASLGHRIFQSSWRGLEPPRHLHLFSQTSIDLYLRRAGFTSTTSRSTIHWADGILRQSVLIRFPVLRRSLVGKTIAALIGATIGQIEAALNGSLWPYGEELLIMARRPHPRG
jgi:2-polyprenyl-3-methyl-5-hydroxy-6-metoxy-1,4-benzoquinol methylase